MTAPHRYTLRSEEVTPAHETIRVFVNGGSAGLLTLRREEAADLRKRVGVHDELIASVRGLLRIVEKHAPVIEAAREIEAANAVLTKVSP